MRTRKTNQPRGSVLKNNLWMLRLVWKYTPFYVAWMIAEGVVWGINNSIGIIYTRHLLDRLGRGVSFEETAAVILLYAIYILLFYVFHNWYWSLYNPRVRERLHMALHSDLFRHAVEMDLARYDDPVFYNDFVWAMDKSYTHATGLVEDTGKLINRVVASVTLTGVLFSVDISVASVIFLCATANVILRHFRNKMNVEYSNKLNPLDRKSGYITRVFRLPDYAKEIRTTHISDVMLRELDRNTEDVKAIKRTFSAQWLLLDTLTAVATTLGNGLPLLLILYKVMVSGTLRLGGFAIAINALWTMSWLLGDLVSRLMKYNEHGLFIEKVKRFLETEPEVKSGSEAVPPFASLSVRNLSFAYPDKESAVLQGVDMEIHRGEKIAIVGYNGAGKTTLIKLLMRLYDPTAGEILYNGQDLRSYRTDELRRHMATVFQDYRIFAASIAENVAGGPYEPGMEASIRQALDSSTFTDKLISLPDGLATPLTREFSKNGTQLSGGEAQKIAIARAFFRQADLIILDEPSSALDPEAEYQLNRAITQYAKEKTVIFISHRLSTTRHTDRIYMFEEGRIIEVGTHEELMVRNGKYAYMFHLQAKKYKYP